jgi:ABC-type antimicrobial peptide transport system permease subunit
MILANGMRLVGLGLALGLAAALALGRALTPILFGVRGTDPLTLAAVAAGVSLVALFATFLPAHRASRLDPTIALRGE